MPRFSYTDVVARTTPASNWSKFAVHPFADRLLWILANYAPVHPNVLTTVSMLLVIGAAFRYQQGDSAGMTSGAIIFYIAFAIDSIDGALARLLQKSSLLGALLDSLADFFRSIILPPALAAGAFRQTDDVRALFLGFAVLGVGLWYLYLAEVSQKLIGERPHRLAQRSLEKHAWFTRLGLVPSPFGLIVDYEATYLIVFPILGRPFEGMLLAVLAGTISRTIATVAVFRHLSRSEQEKR